MMKCELFNSKEWTKLTRRERLLWACWEQDDRLLIVNITLKLGRCTPVTEREYINHFEYLDRLYASRASPI